MLQNVLTFWHTTSMASIGPEQEAKKQLTKSNKIYSKIISCTTTVKCNL